MNRKKGLSPQAPLKPLAFVPRKCKFIISTKYYTIGRMVISWIILDNLVQLAILRVFIVASMAAFVSALLHAFH